MKTIVKELKKFNKKILHYLVLSIYINKDLDTKKVYFSKVQSRDLNKCIDPIKRN